MKALYMTGPDDYGLVERPKPSPGADEALVKVSRAGLCHTDVIIRAGVASHVRYPFIPGHEFAGIVEAVGSLVKFIKPGDRVVVHQHLARGQCPPCRKGLTNVCERYDELGATSDGGFADYCVIPARHLFQLPDHVTLEEGALVEPLANAISAVRHTDIQLGERVVVIGPGPIGLLALQVARLTHPSILVLVGTRDERLKVGESLGADHTVNIKRAGALENLQDILGGKGAEVILDCAGTSSAVELACKMLGVGGRIAFESGESRENLPIPPSVLLSRAAKLIGINGWVTADFGRALDLISRGLVDVKSILTHTFELKDWEMAFEMITTRKSEAIKVEFAFA